jgi:hypothetical protein
MSSSGSDFAENNGGEKNRRGGEEGERTLHKTL